MIKKTRQKLVWPGRYFALVVIAVLLAAINTGTNLLYLIAGALISFLLLSFVLSRRSLRKLSVYRDVPASVYRGEEFSVGLRIENRRPFTSAFSVRLESAAKPGAPVGYLLRIPPRRAVLTRIVDSLNRRGLQPLPELVLVTGYPFGLVEARRAMGDATQVLVYPRVHSIKHSVLEQFLGGGRTPKAVAADGDEFFSLRDYVRGDDFRKIAWRPSARLGNLVVREMETDVTRIVTLFLDTRRTDDAAFEEDFEVAVEAVASLSVALLKARISVSLATPSSCLAEAEGTAQARRLLEFLAYVSPSDAAEPVGESFKAAGRRVGSITLAFSGDASQWGTISPTTGMRTLDPREVIRG